jgi:hypothetical protein
MLKTVYSVIHRVRWAAERSRLHMSYHTTPHITRDVLWRVWDGYRRRLDRWLHLLDGYKSQLQITIANSLLHSLQFTTARRKPFHSDVSSPMSPASMPMCTSDYSPDCRHKTRFPSWRSSHSRQPATTCYPSSLNYLKKAFSSHWLCCCGYLATVAAYRATT